MAILRLFAGLREAAGASRVEIEGSTIGEVLAAAESRFGDRFTAGLATSRVWLNGEEAAPEDKVTHNDEVALIPPVSGGAQTETAPVSLVWIFPLLIGGALAAILFLTKPPVWTAAVVGAMALWMIDLTLAASDRGLRIPFAPALLTILAGAVLGYRFSIGGLGATLLVGVIVSLSYAVVAPSHRGLPALASSAVLSVLAGGATTALVAAISLYEKRVVVAFFIAVAGGSLVAAGLGAARRSLLVDPTVAGFVISLAVFPVAAVVWKLNIVTYLLAGLAVALAMIAGRGIGSLVRSGRVSWTTALPGWLGALDGAVFAACVYVITLDWFG